MKFMKGNCLCRRRNEGSEPRPLRGWGILSRRPERSSVSKNPPITSAVSDLPDRLTSGLPPTLIKASSKLKGVAKRLQKCDYEKSPGTNTVDRVRRKKIIFVFHTTQPGARARVAVFDASGCLTGDT